MLFHTFALALVTFIMSFHIYPILGVTSTNNSLATAIDAAVLKIGLAWDPNNDPSYLSLWKTNTVKYIHTWSPTFPSAAKSLGLTICPMLWGENQISEWQSSVVPGYANIAFGMNEPNEPSESNISPTEGVVLWQTYIQPLSAEGYQLISPVTSSAPSGLTWMQEFFAACGGCTFDGLALHWYEVSLDAFEEYVTSIHDTFNLPIWVTEYGCEDFNGPGCTEDEITDIIIGGKEWMDATDWVVAYFAFGLLADQPGSPLMNSDGSPTSLGSQYIS